MWHQNELCVVITFPSSTEVIPQHAHNSVKRVDLPENMGVIQRLYTAAPFYMTMFCVCILSIIKSTYLRTLVYIHQSNSCVTSNMSMSRRSHYRLCKQSNEANHCSCQEEWSDFPRLKCCIACGATFRETRQIGTRV